MAEAFLNLYGNGEFEAESAGIEKGKLNLFVVKAMQEVGIDISNNQTKEVFDLFTKGRLYHAVITVCDKEAAERCHIFPGTIKRLDWSFPDPSQFLGSDQEILQKIRFVRDSIKDKVIELIKEASDLKFCMQERKFESSPN